MKLVTTLLMSLCLVLGIAIASNAQDKQERQEKIEAAKAAFISKRIQLTPEQEMKFWPVYNDFSAKRKEIRKNIHRLKMDQYAQASTDEELKADLKLLFDLRQKELNLDKEYYDKFLKILSPRQTIELLKAEREFIKLLYKKLEED